MNLSTYLRQVLAAAPQVSALAGERVHADVLPQRPTFPALLIEEVEADEDHALDGPTGVSSRVVDITSWGGDTETTGRAQAGRLAAAVKAVLERHDGAASGLEVQGVFLVGTRRDFEPETRSWLVTQTWNVVVSGTES